MKKRFGLLGLCLLLLFSFVACQQKGEPTFSQETTEGAFPAYQKAFAQIKQAKSLDMEMITNLTLEMTGSSIPLKMDMDIQKLQNGEFIELVAKSSTDIANYDMDMDIYYRDGYLYFATEDQKIKSSVSAADLDAAVGIQIPFFDDASYFKTITETQKDGETEIDFTLSEDVFSKLSEEHLGPVLSALQGMGVEEVKIAVTGYSGRLSLDKEGQPQTIYLALTADLTVSNAPMTVSYVWECDIKGIDTLTSLSFPDNLDQYTESENF